MSNTPIADTIRALEEASVAAQKRLQAIAAEHYAQVGKSINMLAGLRYVSPDLPHALQHYRTRVSSIIVDDLAVKVRDITMRRATTLKVELLLSPPPDFGLGSGYLDAFAAPGEPGLPDGFRYRDVRDLPLAPDVVDVETARASTWGDWWLIAAISAVAHWNPRVLRDMVSRDGDDVVVTVANGVYRFPATLPTSDESPDTDDALLVPSLQKAVAEHFGSYRHLKTGTPAAALQWLVGGIGRTDLPAEFDDERLTAMLAAREPMVAHTDTPPPSTEVQRLAAEHDVVLRTDQAYVLTALDGSGMLMLHNPRAFPQAKHMSLATFRRIFSALSWRDTSDTGLPVDHESGDE